MSDTVPLAFHVRDDADLLQQPDPVPRDIDLPERLADSRAAREAMVDVSDRTGTEKTGGSSGREKSEEAYLVSMLIEVLPERLERRLE